MPSYKLKFFILVGLIFCFICAFYFAVKAFSLGNLRQGALFSCIVISNILSIYLQATNKNKRDD